MPSDGGPTGVNKLIAKSQQRQFSAIALAVLLGLWGSHASALSLGRISVQSALGEPLLAEIEILDINADEAASLSSKIAPPESFKLAGLEYNPALGSVRATLQYRPNGRSFIKLNSDRAIAEPFVDMLLETSWSSGRIVRDYTMLFDPPSLRDANVAVAAIGAAPATPRPVQPSSTAPLAPPLAATTRPEPTSTPLPGKPAAPVTTRPPTPVPAPMPTQVPARPATPPATDKTLIVKAGDTAGRIAIAHKPATVSLDQMLVALLRANPDAFIQNNVNRIKAGAVLDLPSESEAAVTPAPQARQIVIAQSADFNDFRRKFASNAPTAAQAPAARELSGKIQTTVEEKKPAAAATDRLTLSKGAVQGKGTEAELANQRNARETANRAAELAKNLSDLNQLAAASSVAAPASAASSAPTRPDLPAIVATPATVVAAPAASATAEPPAAPAAVASAADAAASATPKASAPAAPALPPEASAETGLMDALLDNPLVPGGAIALLALLAGFAVYRVRQRKAAVQADSDLDAPPEFLLNASGGQSVDTRDDVPSGTSMVYSPSQLDAADEVDPVAEADVYMAYGRDLQAEEILKDALRNTPDRLAIHHKLLEIYAKRGDVKAFESIATLAFNLTDGTGTDWERVCEKGLTIDPDNALYLPGGAPFAKPSPVTGPMPFDDDPTTAPYVPKPPAEKPAGTSSFVDLDLDLDFSDEPAPQADASPPVAAAEFLPEPELADLPAITPDPLAPGLAPQAVSEPELSIEGLDFSLPEPVEPATSDPTLQPPSPSVTEPTDAGADLVDFDLGSLALDMGDEPITVAGALPEGQDPLETKLALAEEFLAIGDDDGARALIEEVIAEASGDMKSKAETALGKL
ncbi:MAG: fimbrial protein FimV [Rhodoferax sp.]|nr:fimbrial protein FimV [Rhodoferax sp.]